MEKMELGETIEFKEGLLQSSFDLRDIHFQSDSLIVYTIQGNIVPLPIASFSDFISAIRSAVKEALINPQPINEEGKIK